MDFDEFFDRDGGEENQNEGGEADFGDIAAEEFFSDLNNQGDESRSKKDSVLFLVDCRRSLFEKLPNSEKTGFEEVLEAYRGFNKSKIIASENDRIGLIFYNIKKENNPLNLKGISIVHTLDTPSADRIKSDFSPNFNSNFGYSESEIPLHDALWLCNHELKTLDQKTFTKRIFLFTNEDLPNPGNKNERDQAIQRARILYEMDVKLELFPLPRQNKKFDIKKFYMDVIAFDPEDSSLAELDISSKIMDLSKRMRAKEFKKRTIGTVNFELGENFKVSFSMYCLINQVKKPNGVFLYAKNNKLLKSSVNFICKDTGATLYPNQIGTCIKLGGDKIPFKKEEMEAIKQFDSPSIKLMGFKPATCLKNYHNLKSSYFVFPNDERIMNSSQVADALIKTMIAKSKIALVKIVPRRVSIPRFAVLIPQIESYDEDHFQTPAGFNLIFLPYADDMKKMDAVMMEKVNEPTAAQVAKAKILINSLTTEVDSRNFENPAIQTFYSRLQAIALDEKNPEPVEDLIVPDEENILRIYGGMIKIFNESFNEDEKKKKGKKKEESKNEEEKGGKRKPRDESAPKKKGKSGFDSMDEGEDSFGDTKAKKSKQQRMEVEDQDAEIKVISEVEHLLKNAELKKLTLDKLKTYLKYKKLNTTGKKDQLIDRALEHISKHGL